MIYSANTDMGLKRSENQDHYVVGKLFENCILAVVCDGMGGAAGGMTASVTASNEFYGYVSRSLKSYINSELDVSGDSTRIIDTMLLDAVALANKAVYEKACADSALAGMGTTLVAVLCIGKSVYAVNVGDSRLYRFVGSLELISHDHSFVQTLVDMNVITREEANVHPKRNVITRVVGTYDSVEPDIFHITVSDGDSLLLCTDGLYGYVSEATIENVLRANEDINEKTKQFTYLANSSGGSDNITSVLITY